MKGTYGDVTRFETSMQAWGLIVLRLRHDFLIFTPQRLSILLHGAGPLESLIPHILLWHVRIHRVCDRNSEQKNQ